MKYFFLLFAGVCGLPFIAAAQAQPSSSAEILLAMKKLQVLGSVLYVGAHPDDENTRLLAYLAKEKLYRTGYLSLTRGDGGQNLIGNEQGIELGLIRTQELLAARRIDGAEQFFSRAFDFGYSKKTEEALKKWDREKILSDVVWVIRKFRPDVIITRFPQDERAGHGHHSASAVLAVEAFSAAADPARFPDQLKYVQAWQAKRILWNTYNFGGTNTTGEEQFKTDVGLFNPLLGESYGEIAAESRSQHKSQGFGVARQRGSEIEYFSTWKGDPPQHDLMDGVDNSWHRVKGGAAVEQKINAIMKDYSLFFPGRSVRALVQLYDMINALEDGYWKEQKLQELKKLIVACSGLFVEATTAEAQLVQTESFRVNFSLNNRNGNNVILKEIVLDKFDSAVNITLQSNRNFSYSCELPVSLRTPVSQPYWLKNEMKEGYFEVSDQQLIGQAENAAAYQAKFVLNIEGHDFDITRPVQQKFTDPVKGELYEPVVVVPPVVISPERNLMLSTAPGPQTVRLTVHAMKDIQKPLVRLSATSGWKMDGIEYHSPEILRKGQEMDVDVRLEPAGKEKGSGKQPVIASVEYDGERYSSLLRTIHYDHIPDITYFRVPVVNLLAIDMKTAGKRIGYIEGAGDYVPVALQQMGYEVTKLSDKDLAGSDLSHFDAIIAGVRAYNIKASLNTYYDKLMKYVENGGNLIVQYNTSNQLGGVKSRVGPYPFSISRARITDENATVKMLHPGDQVLNYPNKITEKDFEGWVQERSIYHASNWDSHYETVLRMHDPGENDDDGSLIITRYGKGSFAYTGLVFFRQLPAGVPGAYRLLANLVALNQKKGY